MKSICVLGVDGTGKSTLVQMIFDALGAEKSVVQYMGSKRWETSFARNFHNSANTSLIGSFLCALSVVWDLYVRVYKHRFNNRIVIFDRYADEQFLNLNMGTNDSKNRFKKFFYTFWFKFFFYRPTVTFYLTCPADVSIARKDDIVTEDDVARLRERKTLFDDYYIGKPGVMTIETDKNSLEQVLSLVLEEIKNI